MQYAMSTVKALWASRELLVNLTQREIRGKYKRTVFGQLWSLANPLALMLIYTFVFSMIFKSQPDPGDPSGLDVFALWLLCGLLPWIFFSNVLSTGLGSLVDNANLIQKVYFNRLVLPLSLVGSVGYSWIFEMGVLVAALIIVSQGFTVLLWVPLALVAMAVLAVFAAGIMLMLTILDVHFRDTRYFMQIILQLWMYMTPIIYPIALVGERSNTQGGLLGTNVSIIDIYNLNPMVHFVNVFRNLLYDNRFPSLVDVLWCLGAATVSIVVGLRVFKRNERGLAELL